MDMIRLLALSGSLRRSSYNSAVIEALKVLVPAQVDLQSGDIRHLPLFDPDREEENIASVAALKLALGEADGLVLASPEYAHGISGPMKNALDWLVSGEEFPGKPVMLINTSPRAHHAQDALREVLRTMSGKIIEPACVAVPLLGSGLDSGGIVEHETISNLLKAALGRFCDAIDCATK